MAEYHGTTAMKIVHMAEYHGTTAMKIVHMAEYHGTTAMKIVHMAEKAHTAFLDNSLSYFHDNMQQGTCLSDSDCKN